MVAELQVMHGTKNIKQRPIISVLVVYHYGLMEASAE